MAQEPVRVLVVVKGGVAEVYAPEFVDARVVDLDCGEQQELPPEFEYLASEADIEDCVAFE